MGNKRQGKSLYNLWLKEEEERLLKEFIINKMWINIALIFEEVVKRGDLQKR